MKKIKIKELILGLIVLSIFIYSYFALIGSVKILEINTTPKVVIFAPLLLSCFYCLVVRVRTFIKNSFYYLFLIWTVYTIIVNTISQIVLGVSISNIGLSFVTFISPFLLFWIFYSLSYEEKIFTRIAPIGIALFCFLSYFFLSTYSEANSVSKRSVLYGLFESLNSIYYPLFAFPFVLLSKKKMVKILGIAFISILTVLSMKRGAMISILLTVLVCLLCISKNKKPRFIIVGFLVSLIGYIVLFKFNEFTNGYVGERFSGMADDGGSGRLDIYKSVLFNFRESNIIETFCGHGYKAVEHSLNGLGAHNEFVETLYDYGIFGLLFYIGMHICIIKFCISLYRKDIMLSMPFVSAYAIYFITCMVSFVYYYEYFYIYASFLGVTMGISKKYPQHYRTDISQTQ